MVRTIVDFGGATVDLFCGECDESLTNDGNNSTPREAASAAKAHAKRTGHTHFLGSRMMWLDVVM